jgi:hypothetical protein
LPVMESATFAGHSVEQLAVLLQEVRWQQLQMVVTECLSHFMSLFSLHNTICWSTHCSFRMFFYREVSIYQSYLHARYQPCSSYMRRLEVIYKRHRQRIMQRTHVT